MGFQFAETMAGTVSWHAEPGARYPLRFDIVVEAASLRQHLRDGRAEVRGVLHAPPIAQGVDVEGVLTIRPLVQRIIRYELAFLGDDGQAYELVGQKDIRWRAARHTFTRLPAEILDDRRRPVATCEARFDLRNDGLSFLRSFRPLW